MTSSGLNKDSILQLIGTATATTTTTATEQFVTDTVNNALNEGLVVDINITGNGLCVFSGISGTTNTVVDIGISSSLTDLLDVNVPTPGTGQYLKWSGTEWIAGSGVSTFSITDLNDFVSTSGTLIPDAFLRVNNTGTSIIQDINNVISDVTGGGGIRVDTPSTGVRKLASDISSLTTVTSALDNPNNYFSIETSSTNATRKIQKKEIRLEGFDQGNFVQSTNISTSVTGGGASTILSHTTVGPCVTFVLDTTDILLSSGGGTASPLSITRGGTSATNISDAQTNLGLSINKDIIGYNRGEFQNSLNGDKIRLIGGISGTSIVSAGSGYGGSTFSGTCLLQATGFNFDVNVNITLGEVTSIINLDPPLHLAENVSGVSLTGAGGSGAIVDIGLCYSYISFGVSVGDNDYDSGYGIRYLPGSELVQFRSSDTSGWVALTNKFGVSGLLGVSASSPADASILIYDGPSGIWNSRILTGTSPGFQLTNAGNVIITITPEDITSSPTITSLEFATLSGICSATGTIQQQLDDKIQVNSTLTYGDVIMYNNTTTPGVSNFTVIPSGTGPASYNFLKQHDSGASGAIFENLFHGFNPQPIGTTIGPSFRFCILDEGTSQANSYNLKDTVEFLTSGTSTGLNANTEGQIALNYNQLDRSTSINPTNLLTFGTPISSGTCYVQSISVEDFLTSSIGNTEEGLCVSAGNIQVKIPTVGNGTSISTTYDGQLAYFYNATTPGPSVLAVSYGGNWYGTCVSLVT